ncbi:helix-turn-helix domain-containing protein [Terrimonas sp. NA20]|uniref:Helix-turn-helix domain-containing protein n=1 Tax=Terrimonas ginsenosidimutans TaxID=2908004 RepID=A0ABS9KPN4_9BACT|nr:helix-turn-helix domain-containing protein [Terrimonas ginsenosidimutans]MCG2614278.1 helix-turn-helix domain-containing protein [Terrimonas ginsenosidimutans]
MSIGQQILFLISALGALNGILLSLYLLFRKKQRSLPAILLSIMLLAISIRIGNTVFVYFNNDLSTLYLQVGHSAAFLVGPAVYFFFRAALNKPVTGLPHSAKLVWGILCAIIVIGGLAFPYTERTPFWCTVIPYIVYAQWAFFLIATGILLKPVFQRLISHETALSTTEKFWMMLYGGNCIIFLSYQLSLTGIFSGLCLAGAMAFSVILFVTLFYYLYGMEMENILQIPEAARTKTIKKTIAEADAISWVEKLEAILAGKELYKDPNLKIGDLAQKINITGHQLSQLLNEHLGKNFPTFINEYRINEACKLIATDDRRSFEAIGYEVGFNSKSTFYTSFRKVTGTTPALFKEKLSAAGPA